MSTMSLLHYIYPIPIIKKEILEITLAVYSKTVSIMDLAVGHRQHIIHTYTHIYIYQENIRNRNVLNVSFPFPFQGIHIYFIIVSDIHTSQGMNELMAMELASQQCVKTNSKSLGYSPSFSCLIVLVQLPLRNASLEHSFPTRINRENTDSEALKKRVLQYSIKKHVVARLT